MPYTNETRNKKRRLIQRWKQRQPCNHCGNKFHFSQLDLDHIDPTTKIDTKAAIRRYGSKHYIKEQLKHIQVLCKNCHAYKTWKNKEYVVNRGLK